MELSFKSNDATIKLTKTAITKEDFDRVYEIISSNYVKTVTPVQECVPSPLKNSPKVSMEMPVKAKGDALDASIMALSKLQAPKIKPVEELITKPVESERSTFPIEENVRFKREEVKVKVSSCPSCGHTGQQRVLRGSKFVNCDVCGEKLFLKPAGATWNERDDKGNEYRADSLYFEKKEY